MTRWRLGLAVAVALGLAIWGLGLRGSRTQPTGLAAPAPKLRTIPPAAPPVNDVLQPEGKPEFVADFEGSSLDTSVWDTCYPYDSQSGCQNFGNSKYEGEWYIPSQVQVGGGMLHLVAQRQPVLGQSSTGAPEEYGCRSGMVTSYPGLQFEYGYLQIVAQIPTNPQLWSAIWLAAANFQWPPETDIIEAWGRQPFYSAAYFHWEAPTGSTFVGGPVTPAQRAAGWHTFALSWTKTQMTWLIDGKVILTVRQHIPQQKMYLIMNLADSISPQAPTVEPGQCDGTLNIRSVKLWAA